MLTIKTMLYSYRALGWVPHQSSTEDGLSPPSWPNCGWPKTYKNANKAGSSSLKRQDAPNLVARQCSETKIQWGGIEAERGGEKVFRGRASATERPVGKCTGYANVSRGHGSSYTVYVQVSPLLTATSIPHFKSNNLSMMLDVYLQFKTITMHTKHKGGTIAQMWGVNEY